MNADEPTKCALCGGARLVRLFRTTGWGIVECRTCRNAFTCPSPTVPDYASLDFQSDRGGDDGERLTTLEDLPPEWQRQITTQQRMVADNFPVDADILEIGCGEGILLKELAGAGFGNLRGIEPSRSGARRALRKGLQVSNGYFDAAVVDQKFDLVMMSHVFEHVPNASAFLSSLLGVLKPGGSIMLTQTNYRGLLPRLYRERWYAWMPDQHFWHFSPMGLKQMLQRHGLHTYALTRLSLVHPGGLWPWIARRASFLQDQFVIMARVESS